tara:strand:- start:75 stop:656 length:582 start_codon:yes stop_codon:yes gene_type:complete
MKILLKLGVLIFLFLYSLNSFSQDLFIYKNGSELNVKVLRVNKNDISYKKNSNINGPEYVEDKINLFMIKYENGTKDIFINNSEEKNIKENLQENIVTDTQESNCKHQVDSIIFMNNKYMIVCKDCNKKIRYATPQEVKSNIANDSEGIRTNNMPCGSEPKKPPSFNDPQYKVTPTYKKYKKDHKLWRDCSGN